jgi:hypothetical protein
LWSPRARGSERENGRRARASQRLGQRPALIRASSLHSRSTGPPSARLSVSDPTFWRAVGRSPCSPQRTGGRISVRVLGWKSLSTAARKIHHLQVTVEVGEERLRAQPLLPLPPASHPELLELLPQDGGVDSAPRRPRSGCRPGQPHTESLPIDREIERQHAVLLAQLDPCSILFVLEYPCLRLRM